MVETEILSVQRQQYLACLHGHVNTTEFPDQLQNNTGTNINIKYLASIKLGITGQGVLAKKYFFLKFVNWTIFDLIVIISWNISIGIPSCLFLIITYCVVSLRKLYSLCKMINLHNFFLQNRVSWWVGLRRLSLLLSLLQNPVIGTLHN